MASDMRRGSFCVALAAAVAVALLGCGGQPSGKTGEPPKTAKKSPEERYTPVSERPRMSDEDAMDALIKDLVSEDMAKCWPAEEDLKGYGKAVLPKIRPLLKSERLEVRASALRVVDASGREEVLPDLIDLLLDEDAGIRHEAFQALRRRTMQSFGYSHTAEPATRQRTQQLWRDWYARFKKDVAPPGEGGQEPPKDAADPKDEPKTGPAQPDGGPGGKTGSGGNAAR